MPNASCGSSQIDASGDERLLLGRGGNIVVHRKGKSHNRRSFRHATKRRVPPCSNNWHRQLQQKRSHAGPSSYTVQGSMPEDSPQSIVLLTRRCNPQRANVTLGRRSRRATISVPPQAPLNRIARHGRFKRQALRRGTCACRPCALCPCWHVADTASADRTWLCHHVTC